MDRSIGDAESDSSFSLESFWSDSPRSMASPSSYEDFVGRMPLGPSTSTQQGCLTPELFTDSMVNNARESEVSPSPVQLLSIPTPVPPPSFIWEQRASRTPALPFDDTECGWTVPVIASMTEYDFWKALFPQTMLEKLVHETNNYANKIIGNTAAPSRRQNNFKFITENEILRYFVIRILMGIDEKPELVHYWSKDPIFRSLIIPQIMPSDRFFEIQRYLHLCSDDEEAEQEEQDKLRKIRVIWEGTMMHFKSLLVPFRDISVDESLTKFKGRLSFKQFIPSKRNRFGIKSYSLVDEKTGFIVDSIVYTGKDDTAVNRQSKTLYGHGGSTLLKLCEPHLGKYRRIFADNYFTSPVLAEKLLHEKTYLCGTLRSGRKNTPKAPKMKKGEIVTYSCNKENSDIMVEFWRDKRIVRIISTGQEHKIVESANARGSVKRKLESVVQYNDKARGTDRADMFIGYYDSARKTMKWPTKMFFRLLELIIYNSYVMMRTVQNKPFLQFRLNLVRQLLQATGGLSLERENKIPRPNMEAISDDRLSRRCVCPIKCTKRRCVVCSKNGKQSRTTFMCKNCEVPLCIIPCFEIFHTKKHF